MILKKGFQLLALPLLGLLIGLAGQNQTAEASYFEVGQIQKTTPIKWRGNWYAYVNGHICVTHINKYSVTQTYKGKTHSLFRSNWKGYRKLAVAKVKNSDLITFNALANHAYQTDGGWKISKQTVNSQKLTVLRDYHNSRSYIDLFRAPVYKSYGH